MRTAIGCRSQLEAQQVESMHEFRDAMFVRKLGWSLPMLDDTERDEYDDANAVYVVMSEKGQGISACARLLPTTGRYMLPELFPELLAGRDAPCDEGTWELSRFACATNARGVGLLSASKATFDLFRAVLGYASQQGVRRLLFVTSIAIERLLLRYGFDVHRIARPVAIADDLCIALVIEVTSGAICRADSALH